MIPQALLRLLQPPPEEQVSVHPDDQVSVHPDDQMMAPFLAALGAMPGLGPAALGAMPGLGPLVAALGQDNPEQGAEPTAPVGVQPTTPTAEELMQGTPGFADDLAAQRQAEDAAINPLMAAIGERIAALQPPPQRGAVGIDTDDERRILQMVQLATGDTALAGAVANTILSDEEKAVEREFQNALLLYEFERDKLDMQNSFDLQSIELVKERSRRYRDDMELVAGDQQRNMMARIHADEMAARAEERQWRNYTAFAEAITSPLTPPEERERLLEEARNYLTPTQISLLRSRGTSTEAKTAYGAFMQSMTNLVANALDQQKNNLAVGILIDREAVNAGIRAQVQAAFDQLPEAVKDLVRSDPSFQAVMSDEGVLYGGTFMPQEAKPRTDAEIKDVASGMIRYLRDTFTQSGGDLHASTLREAVGILSSDPRVQQEARTMLRDAWKVSTNDAGASILSLQSGVVPISINDASWTNTDRAFIIAEHIASTLRDGRNPFLMFVNQATGELEYFADPSEKYRAWLANPGNAKWVPLMYTASVYTNRHGYRLERSQNGRWRIVQMEVAGELPPATPNITPEMRRGAEEAARASAQGG